MKLNLSEKSVFSKLLLLLMIVAVLVCAVACGGTEEPASGDGTKPGAGGEKITIEETLCFEYEGFKVTAKSLEKNELKLLLENNGTEARAMSVDEVVVNGCVMSSLLSEEVAPGKKSNQSLEIYSTQMKDAGISFIGEITVYCHLYDPETYMTVKNIDPFTIRTSAYERMEARNTEGRIVYDDNDVKVIIKSLKDDPIWGESLLLYVENNGSTDIGVSCESLSVNGFMMTTLFSETIFCGTYTVSDLELLSSSLEENGITDIESISFSLNFYNKQNYQSLFKTEEITYQVK